MRKFTGKQFFNVNNGAFVSPEISAKFEIDFNHPNVKETIIEMNRSWAFSPDRSAPFEEHLIYWLKLATCTLYRVYNDTSLESAKQLDEHLWNHEEGFAYGRYIGIKVIYFYSESIDMDTFSVDELE